jgi:hypothetical protein
MMVEKNRLHNAVHVCEYVIQYSLPLRVALSYPA